MSIKTATPELHERMRRASANIAAGVRLAKPELELEGRRTSAIAHIENQIRLGRAFLTPADITLLARLLHDIDEEDYTADAVETTKEALARVPSEQMTTADLLDDEDDEDF